MGIVSILWALWGASFVFMIVMSIFSARLGRNEEAQIFLAESSNHVKSEQDEIKARVGKVRPIKKASLAIAGIMTVVVLGYYLLDIFHRFGG
jgi:hypothetical protein